jgi:hypothetical protein
MRRLRRVVKFCTRFSTKCVHRGETTRAVLSGDDDDDEMRLDNNADGGHAGSMISNRSSKGPWMIAKIRAIASSGWSHREGDQMSNCQGITLRRTSPAET